MPVNEIRRAAVEPKPRRRGRPSIITMEIIEILERSIMAGNFVVTACQKARIPTVRFYSWMNKGRYYVENEGVDVPEEDLLYVELYERISMAQADAEDAAVKAWYKIGLDGDWKALEAFLGKRYSSRWGSKKLEMSVQGGNLDLILQSIAKADPVLQMQIEEEIEKRFAGVDITALLEEGEQ